MNISIHTLANVLNAKASTSEEKHINLQQISIDSRSLKNTPHTLFFALKGKIHDGHHFIDDLYKKGVRLFVVEKKCSHLPKAIFFEVENTLDAFQKFAAYYRQQFDIKTIGITGSNGKTIVKEWLSFLLSSEYKVVKSPKSYNSQVGVPLSVLGINKHHDLGIFEAGISTTGEMEKLDKIILPNIGVFTNIGSAHDEGFVDNTQKIKEKLKLFAQAEKIIVPNIPEIVNQISADKKWVWGYSPSCDVYYQLTNKQSVRVKTQHLDFDCTLPFSDAVSIHNSLVCIATLLYLGISEEDIKKNMPLLPKINMRLEVKKGKQGCQIIDDSYSSDYQSLILALDFLHQQHQKKKKTLIISDILQSGLPYEELYQKVASLIKPYQIDKIIGIGNQISTYLPNEIRGVYFSTTEEFLSQYNMKSFANETILIKGARLFSFEKIVSELESKTHETILEVNLSALTHNYNYFKSLCHPNTKIMVMLKAFGYGNGTYEIAKLLEHLHTSMIGVAFADEGIQMRKSGIKMPIMVMNPERSAFQQMIYYQLEPEIFSIEMLEAFVNELKIVDRKKYPIHLKLNTGMNRLGFREEELHLAFPLLKNNPYIEIKSVFSHLAVADEPSLSKYTLAQGESFKKLCLLIEENLKIKPTKHLLNSSGVTHFPSLQFDQVRLGIGLYGIGTSEEAKRNLEPVSQLKTIILQAYEIDKGEAVGYGRNFISTKKTRIGILPIGYADGIRRSYGNGNGEVAIRDKRYPIIGNICMDMMMIDLGDDLIEEGETVEIFGENISIEEVAKKWQTIPYEVMTSISQRVKRIFYKET